MSQKNEREYRSFEGKAVEDKEYRVEGYAATFEPYKMCEIEGESYFERIEPTAFDETDMSDVVLRVDHAGAVYARTSAGTVELTTDEHGLHIEADLSKTANSRALYEDIKVGNYPQMSFAFTVAEDGDRYDKENRTRVITNIRKLYDVSPVSFPANPGTELHARALEYFNGVIDTPEAERPEEVREAEEQAELREEGEPMEEVVIAETVEAEEVREEAVEAEEAVETPASDDSQEERAAQIEQAIAHADMAERVASGAIGTVIEAVNLDSRKDERKMFEINTVEYRDAWVKNLCKLPMTDEEQRALTSAGAVIPTMTVNAVWDKLVKQPDLLGKVDVSQFASYVRFPRATTNNAATAQAVGDTITASADVIGYVDLIPNEYVKLLEVGADIDHMAVPAVHDWIVDNLVGQIRYAINKDALIGTGTNSLKGIATSVSSSATVPATLTKNSLLGIMAALDSNYQAGAVWIMTPSMFYSEVMALTALNDYVINDGFSFKLFGHDVILMSEALISSKENIFYGDPKAYKVNIFKPLEVKRFETATTTNLQFRGACLADGELIDTAAFTRAARA